MNIAFFGLPLAALALRHDGHDLGLAALSPIEAPGRWRLEHGLGRELIVDALGLEHAQVEELVDRRLALFRPDLLVCWFWTRQLPSQWLARARLGGIGVHPSLLPRHRGPDPFFWTIDSGDTQAGISVYELDAEYDTGPVFWQEALPVGGRNSWQLARALDRPGLKALRHVVSCLAAGEHLQARPQATELATWAGRPRGSDLLVDWSWTTERILRRIRALAPVPGLALELRGVRFLVVSAEERGPAVSPLEPGEAAVGTEVTVRTGDGTLALTHAVVEDDSAGGELRCLEGQELAELVGGAGDAPGPIVSRR